MFDPRTQELLPPRATFYRSLCVRIGRFASIALVYAKLFRRGKGWGDFDVLLDFGVNLPTGDFHKLGTPLLTNVTFQYKLLNVLWPQVEVNYTYWPNGPDRGKNQVFLLPGLLLGLSRCTSA